MIEEKYHFLPHMKTVRRSTCCATIHIPTQKPWSSFPLPIITIKTFFHTRIHDRAHQIAIDVSMGLDRIRARTDS